MSPIRCPIYPHLQGERERESYSGLSGPVIHQRVQQMSRSYFFAVTRRARDAAHRTMAPSRQRSSR